MGFFSMLLAGGGITLPEIIPNPNDIPNIAFRYNFIDPANYTLTGALIESMEDVSGQSAGQAVKKTDADRPAFVASGELSKPCAFFQGVTAPLIAPAIVGASYTKICIMNAKGLVVGNGNRHYFGGSTGHLMGINPLTTSNWQFSDVFKSVTYTAMSPKDGDSDIIIFILTHTANDTRMYIGDTLYDQDLTQPANTDASAYLGGYNNIATNSAKGECYEWMLYNRSLNETEIGEIVDYAMITYARDITYNYIALGIGQSNNMGTASGASPTHTGSSVELNSSSKIIRTINDSVGKERAIDGGNREALVSSLYPRLANQLQLNQTKNMLFAQHAVGGSAAGVKGDPLHWGATGSSQPIREEMITTLTQLKNWFAKDVSFIVDIQGESDRDNINGTTYTEAEFVAYKQDLYDAIWAVSPTTKILVSKIAYLRDASDIATLVAGTDAVNSAYDTLVLNNTGKVYVVHNAVTYTKTSGDIEADGIHWTIQGLNSCADSIETWIGLNI